MNWFVCYGIQGSDDYATSFTYYPTTVPKAGFLLINIMERAARIPYHLFDQSNDLGYRQKEAVGRFDRVADRLSKLILKADQLRQNGTGDAIGYAACCGTY